MSELAKLIEVERHGDKTSLLINGEELPWHIAPGVDLHVGRTECPGVTLTILADEVKAIDGFAPLPPPSVTWRLIDAKDETTDLGSYSTAQSLLPNDLIQMADESLLRVEKIDPENLIFFVAPYVVSP